MIKIVTDSSVDLPPDLRRELDVTVVPLSIHFGDTTYVDGEEIDADTFYRLLRTETAHPRTSQPPVGRFEAVFREHAAAGHEVVAITLASTLSGTYNSAALAARNVSEARVTVIDSNSVSMAMGALVLAAARLARQDRPAEEIAAAVRAMIPRQSILILVDTLTYLQRGGRIGRAASLAGTLLNVKPILTLRDGQVTPLKRLRTHARALTELVTLVEAQAPIDEMYVMHAAAPEVAARLAGMLRPAYGGREVPALPLGPVVGVHIGPGSVGVAMLRAGSAPDQTARPAP